MVFKSKSFKQRNIFTFLLLSQYSWNASQYKHPKIYSNDS